MQRQVMLDGRKAGLLTTKTMDYFRRIIAMRHIGRLIA